MQWLMGITPSDMHDVLSSPECNDVVVDSDRESNKRQVHFERVSGLTPKRKRRWAIFKLGERLFFTETLLYQSVLG